MKKVKLSMIDVNAFTLRGRSASYYNNNYVQLHELGRGYYSGVNGVLNYDNTAVIGTVEKKIFNSNNIKVEAIGCAVVVTFFRENGSFITSTYTIMADKYIGEAGINIFDQAVPAETARISYYAKKGINDNSFFRITGY